ncbi:hypothetical protein MUN88_17145 [Gracilibacillus caseinilyticus]|uniref:Uncharacterized protein n=1 Tax=Gracilibacillus caseinilyticus TaxID=2932256 RepID=A0ABY4EVS7_9BACI|nr:hypothetical protein [Gracilibacillus caseinilyticus]UOQ47759.1 hypothetical protein MUN88_17145 [Gracilibacillus caseinilyticus]
MRDIDIGTYGASVVFDKNKESEAILNKYKLVFHDIDTIIKASQHKRELTTVEENIQEIVNRALKLGEKGVC